MTHCCHEYREEILPSIQRPMFRTMTLDREKNVTSIRQLIFVQSILKYGKAYRSFVRSDVSLCCVLSIYLHPFYFYSIFQYTSTYLKKIFIKDVWIVIIILISLLVNFIPLISEGEKQLSFQLINSFLNFYRQGICQSYLSNESVVP